MQSKVIYFEINEELEVAYLKVYSFYICIFSLNLITF